MFQQQTFGSNAAAYAALGTALAQYEPVVGKDDMNNNDVKCIWITCMKEYNSKCVEELRLEDYTAGRRGSSGATLGPFQQPTAGNPLFSTNCFGFGFDNTATTAAPSAGGLFGSAPFDGQGAFSHDTSGQGHGATALAKSFGSGMITSFPFGSFEPTSGIGAFGSTLAFGTTTAAQPTTGAGFGFDSTATTTASSTGGLSGSAPSHSQGSFGQQTSGQGHGVAVLTKPFGSGVMTTTPSFGRFVPVSASGVFSSTLAQSPSGGAALGTALAQYEPVVGKDDMTNNDVKCVWITCMKEYNSKCVEELRLEDYTAGRRGSSGDTLGPFQQPTAGRPLFSTNCFGFGFDNTATTTAPSGGGLLGSAPSNSKGLFGQQSSGLGHGAVAFAKPFGSGVGTTSSPFGRFVPTTASGVFGLTSAQPVFRGGYREISQLGSNGTSYKPEGVIWPLGSHCLQHTYTRVPYWQWKARDNYIKSFKGYSVSHNTNTTTGTTGNVIHNTNTHNLYTPLQYNGLVYYPQYWPYVGNSNITHPQSASSNTTSPPCACAEKKNDFQINIYNNIPSPDDVCCDNQNIPEHVANMGPDTMFNINNCSNTEPKPVCKNESVNVVQGNASVIINIYNSIPRPNDNKSDNVSMARSSEKADISESGCPAPRTSQSPLPNHVSIPSPSKLQAAGHSDGTTTSFKTKTPFIFGCPTDIKTSKILLEINKSKSVSDNDTSEPKAESASSYKSSAISFGSQVGETSKSSSLSSHNLKFPVSDTDTNSNDAKVFLNKLSLLSVSGTATMTKSEGTEVTVKNVDMPDTSSSKSLVTNSVTSKSALGVNNSEISVINDIISQPKTEITNSSNTHVEFLPVAQMNDSTISSNTTESSRSKTPASNIFMLSSDVPNSDTTELIKPVSCGSNISSSKSLTTEPATSKHSLGIPDLMSSTSGSDIADAKTSTQLII